MLSISDLDQVCGSSWPAPRVVRPSCDGLGPTVAGPGSADEADAGDRPDPRLRPAMTVVVGATIFGSLCTRYGLEGESPTRPLPSGSRSHCLRLARPARQQRALPAVGRSPKGRALGPPCLLPEHYEHTKRRLGKQRGATSPASRSPAPSCCSIGARPPRRGGAQGLTGQRATASSSPVPKNSVAGTFGSGQVASSVVR